MKILLPVLCGLMQLGSDTRPLTTTRNSEVVRPKVVRKISVTVERKVGNKMERMDPAHVFESGELVRFRFQANFPGYLYVLNQSTSGKGVLLFPKEETGLDNRIDKDREYLMPMTDSGWFKMEGPAGHEVTYWVVSPAKLSGRPQLVDATVPPASAMTPRCDDSIFQARGDCIDVTAGPQPVKSREDVPESLSGLVATPRELTMTKSGSATSVLVPADNNEPLIYTFRLAHK